MACKWAGYDGGVYAEVLGKAYCHCIDAKDYRKLVAKGALMMPTRRLPAAVEP